MGLISGYEHHYRFSYTEALIPSSYQPLSDLGKLIIFEIRTKFTLRSACGYEILDTEGLSVNLPADQSCDSLEQVYTHFNHISNRLDEYLMTDDQIQSFIRKVLDYAQQITAVHPSRPVVPIVVDFLVSTVQLDGEPLEDAVDRSVRPGCLIPLDLLRPDGAGKDDDDPLRDYLLYGLPRIRGYDVHVEGFGALMETCPICLGGPTAAAPVSLLPCRHAFHSHCLVRWLMVSESCPLCRHDKIVLIENDEELDTRNLIDEELDTSQVNNMTRGRLITHAQPTNHQLTSPARERRARVPTVGRARVPRVRRARVRRAPAWHDDYGMGSTNHSPVQTRVRRAPAWHVDFVMG